MDIDKRIELLERQNQELLKEIEFCHKIVRVLSEKYYTLNKKYTNILKEFEPI